MTFFQRCRRWVTAIALICLLTISTTACSTATQAPASDTVSYGQLERGNSTAGQEYGDWVVNTAQGLVSDAYVRDNNKLAVVITEQVRPDEVRDLSRALLQGFRQSFPDKDLTVYVYSPGDQELILTADYDVQSNEVEYNTPT